MLKLILKPLSLLSLRQLHALGMIFGNLLFVMARSSRRQIKNNIQQSGLYPNDNTLMASVKRNMQETGKSLLESFALWQKPQYELLTWVTDCHDWHLVEKAQQQSRGIIFLTPHQGCFEITSIYYGSHYPITVLYRPPKLRWLSSFIEVGRKQPGVNLALTPADPVSVIGFPFGQAAGGVFGVWATGFLASEPAVDFDNLPVQLIDCRTRPGQSGSPVIAHRNGGMVALEDGSSVSYTGPVARFVGIYSGRINNDSDLGIVWKASAIEQLLA
ncbi:MAG: hypothetical protein FGM31_03265, partial [Candidatus Methylopumilus sp.]|nr:hypothetical protein [Candidatus Methylopumilus sp.]